MKKRDTLKSENGSILVTSLMMLVLLTLIGISATTTSSIEMRVARNERVYKDNLYTAESAVMASAQTLENVTDTSELKDLNNADRVLSWLHVSLPNNDVFDDENWDTDANTALPDADSQGTFFAVYDGIAPGSSMDIGSNATLLHQFGLYGQSNKSGGLCTIAAGYKRRY